MIKGVHALFYSSQTDELRAFMKDKLCLPYTDVGGGWLIFDLPEGDVGCHPTEDASYSGTHNVSFYCDDLKKTVAELSARGVVFDDEIADHGYGYVTHVTMPGGVKVQIYQPKYAKRTKAKAASPRKAAAKRPAPKKKAKKAKARKR
jgi:hypothetical protein